MTQRNKNILLILGFIAVLFLCYQVSIKKTFALKTEITKLNDSISRYEYLSKESQNLKAKESYFDSILSTNNLKNISIQNNILEDLNTLSEKKGFSIIGFNEPHSISENGINISSYAFTVQGDFNDILELIYHFEQETNLGKISHVNFEKKKNYRRNSNYLECFIVIESLISE
jgi:hypothetical protein